MFCFVFFCFFSSLVKDGRGINEFRETTLSVGNIGTTLGSSFVKIGNTKVICGIKGEIGPRNSVEDKIKVAMEMSSIANGEKPGHSSAEGTFIKQKLSSLLCDVIDDLNVEPEDDKYCWYLYVDLYCLDDDGNVFDVSVLSVAAALSNTSLPKVHFDKTLRKYVQDQGNNSSKLSLKEIPFSVTFAVFEKWILADPTHEEEEVCNAKFTIIIDGSGKLCSVEKRGGQTVSLDQLRTCLGFAKQRVSKLNKQLNTK